MENAAMWATMGTLITGLFGYLGLRLKNAQQDARIATLEDEHKRCQQERADLNKEMCKEWPSDPQRVIAAMAALKQAGIPATIAELVKIIDKARK